MSRDDHILFLLDPFLKKLDLNVESILTFNPSKSQVTALVINPRKKRFILKVVGEKSLVHSQNEQKFYLEYGNQLSFVPKMIQCGPNYLLMEYYDTLSLRSFLLSQPSEEDLDKVLLNLKNLITSFYKPESYYVDSQVRQTLECQYRNLLVSGPQGQTRLLLIDYLFKGFARITSPLAKLTLPEICGVSQPIHGDLHLNNILVEQRNLKLWIVDWENWCFGSSFEDIFYMSVMLEKILPKSKKIKVKEFLPEKTKKFYFCLRFAIGMNSKF